MSRLGSRWYSETSVKAMRSIYACMERIEKNLAKVALGVSNPTSPLRREQFKSQLLHQLEIFLSY